MTSPLSKPLTITRRAFNGQLLRRAAAVLSAPALVSTARSAPAIIDAAKPTVSHGVASGDVSFDSALVWSRSDRPARMVVEWSVDENFAARQRIIGPTTSPEEDFTAKLELKRLPAGTRIFYRVRFEDRQGQAGSPTEGQFVTAPRDERDILFAWSGDTCGQGYGIDSSRGGLKTYGALREMRPDFFIHSGDTIYGDGALQAEMKLPDGTIWKNLVTPEKSKVAETLAEFRGNHRYNLLDPLVRAFNADVPIFAQWDDHEVRNNWYPTQILDDARYRLKDVNELAKNGRRAFLDYLPVRENWRGRIFRRIPRGPLCEIFVVDLRTYRGRNNANRQEKRSAETAYFGDRQLRWLQGALKSSQACWKIIACDMPIGLIVGDGKAFENGANGNGPALGRELEVAALLKFMKENRIRNTVWLTADVHYAASHYYDPAKAQFTDFDPFWEFVSGPLHAASLAPGSFDNTFGPVSKWTARPRGAKSSGPYSNEQFFSSIRIDGKTRVATVTHHDQTGKRLTTLELPPAEVA